MTERCENHSEILTIWANIELIFRSRKRTIHITKEPSPPPQLRTLGKPFLDGTTPQVKTETRENSALLRERTTEKLRMTVRFLASHTTQVCSLLIYIPWSPLLPISYSLVNGEQSPQERIKKQPPQPWRIWEQA